MSKKSVFPNPFKAIKQILGGLGYVFNKFRSWLASLPDWGKLLVWIFIVGCILAIIEENARDIQLLFFWD
jgi:hypothetical protein